MIWANPIHVIESFKKVQEQIRLVLIVLLSAFYSIGSALGQSCPLATLTTPDTVYIYAPLGKWEVSTLDLFQDLGIDSCTTATVFPNGPYLIGSDQTVVLMDQGPPQRIVETFTLSIDPLPLGMYIMTGSGSQLANGIIEFPLAAGETNATKNMVLDQLGVPMDDVIRSQISFFQGSARVTNFVIGDTIFIDRIEGNGFVYYEDVRLLFTPQVPTFSGIMDFDLNLSTCKISIEEVMSRLGYTLSAENRNKFTISQSGPFGYGNHIIDQILLGTYPLLESATISVSASNGPRNTIDFGLLPEGQCFLNESDIVTYLGIDQPGRDCDLSLISFDPAGPYRDTLTTINRILIGGVPIWTAAFEVQYRTDIVIAENSNLFCNDNLNISMNQDCQVFIDADDLLESGAYCHLNYDIRAAFRETPNDVIYEGNKLRILQPGEFAVTITNPSTDNKCWTYIKVEDKYMADIVCPADTVRCYDLNHLTPDTDPFGGPDFPTLNRPATYVATAVPAVYDVVSNSMCDISKASYTDELVDECQNEFKLVIDRLWTFEDPAGNQDTCKQRIYVESANVNLVDKFDRYTANCLSDFAEFDDQGWPSPEITGYPTLLDSIDARVCANLKMNYTDSSFPLCGNSVKLARIWTILDWCTDEVVVIEQIIQIEDKVAPVFAPLQDIFVDSDPFICGQINIELPTPAYEDCSDEVTMEIYYETLDFDGNRQLLSNGSSLIIPEINMMEVVSSFKVIYRLSDVCGNVAKDSLQITIEDKEAPVAVCDQYTTISIGGNGVAQIRALTFDDLSVDNCGISNYMARKIDGECYVDNIFSENIRFCCEEVGDTIAIEFQVEDWAGNKNQCYVEVYVQDKFKPQITCPDSVTLDCGADYNDFTLTGIPTYRDNCDGLELVNVDEEFLNSCGQGYIKRTWIITDRGEFEETCVQIITIKEDENFGLSEIEFPAHLDIEGCMGSLEPEETGKPILSPNGCANVDASHEDLYFYDVEEACFKILREWTVVDWCQLSDEDASAGFWTDVQIIKVFSELGPEISLPEVPPICISGNACEAAIEIVASAVDGDLCTPEENITWTYGLWNSDTGMPIKAGASPRVLATLEVGSYHIIYAAQDECDNSSSDTLNFVVIDCKSPSITCPPLQPTLVLDEDGLATLDISSIQTLITDNCDNAADVTVSFESDQLVSSLDYDCSNIPDGVEELGFITVYASDQGGNKDSCELFLLIKDNSTDVCPDIVEASDTAMIAGLITTEEFIEVGEVSVRLTSGVGETSTITTDEGVYAFENLKRGEPYEVSMQKNEDLLDGVTTTDIVLIQRHLLGLRYLDSPYKLIAADADNNERVTSADLIVIRRAILGQTVSFKNGQESWRFVDANQTWVNEFSPFPFVEKLNVQHLSENIFNGDFMAIKIGDVNGSNKISSQFKSKSRSGVIPITIYRSSERISVISTRDAQLAGLQLGLNIGPDSRDLGEIEAGLLPIQSGHQLIDLDNGVIRISWSDQTDQKIEKGEELFAWNIKSENEINSPITLHTSYASEWIESDLKVSPLALQYEEESEPVITVTMKISPNPWMDQTELNIDLSKSEDILIEILDMSGRVLLTRNEYMPKGRNSMLITAAELNNISGVLLVRISTTQKQYIERMTIVR